MGDEYDYQQQQNEQEAQMTMSVYKKLNKARKMLHEVPLKKSGHNKFAGYYYFELGDFLEPALKIFDEVGLCGVVSFGKEAATLTVHDLDTGDKIVFESPMSSADLKGCHAVQNLGAVETYERRYLWVAALEIVENDILDATTGKGDKPPVAEKMTAEALDAEIAKVAACKDATQKRVLYQALVAKLAESQDVEGSKRLKAHFTKEKNDAKSE